MTAKKEGREVEEGIGMHENSHPWAIVYSSISGCFI
jgi:hypothetical protein